MPFREIKSQARNGSGFTGALEEFEDRVWGIIYGRFNELKHTTMFRRDISFPVQVTVSQKDTSEEGIAHLATEVWELLSSSLERPTKFAITLSPLADGSAWTPDSESTQTSLTCWCKADDNVCALLPGYPCCLHYVFRSLGWCYPNHTKHNTRTFSHSPNCLRRRPTLHTVYVWLLLPP